MAKLRSIPPEQIIARIRLENPWWESPTAPVRSAALPKRLYFQPFLQQATQKSVHRALVLMGPRRVGKTVMLQQLVAQLLKDGYAHKKVGYVSIDAPIYNNLGLEQIFALCRQATGDENPAGYTIIFDEVQYLKEWEVHLKSMTDLFPDTRFIVSGSAAAALKLKSNESGAGRFTDFLLPPLTFEEFLHLKGCSSIVSDADNAADRQGWDAAMLSLNEQFLQYINFGGYPEVLFNDSIQADPGRYVRNDIIDKVLLRDLPSLYGIRDVQELNSLFNVIAYNSGNEVNLEGLSQQSGVDKSTIRKYLEYLEAAFLVRIIYPLGIDARRFLRASRFKIYLTNPSMRCALFTPISFLDEHFGQMVETAIFAQYAHANMTGEPLHYVAWTGGEVDLVTATRPGKPSYALEIKWSDQYFRNPNKLRSLLRFALENQLEAVAATTINEKGMQQVGNTEIHFQPAALFCYSIGRIGFMLRWLPIQRS
ncbi:MAG: ATP-binding protein [Chitinophagaceae bacterium]|nr:MAG: ATP-binding protein [Chitinophagaceae bacterium]